MRSKIWGIALLTGLFFQAVGQQSYDFNSFKGIRSEGEVPSVFLDTRLDLFEKQQQTLLSDLSRFGEDKKLEQYAEEFSLESAEYNKNFLGKGNFLYGDPLTAFTQKVLDRVLEHHEIGNDEIQLIIYNSPIVNALTSDLGLVFVTTGLLSKVGSVEELAFILSHELIHYEYSDGFKKYVSKQSVDQQLKRYKTYSDGMDMLQDYLDRSREIELRCDSIGNVRVCAANSRIQSTPDTLFNAISRVDLPYKEVKFDTQFFSSFGMDVPEVLFKTKVKKFDKNKPSSDVRKTHPDLVLRREKLAQIQCTGSADLENEDWTSLDEELREIQTLAQFECVRLQNQGRDYSRAIFNAYALQESYPNSTYLKEEIAKGLYSIAQFKVRNKFNYISNRMNSSVGEMERANDLWKSLSKEQVATIALKYLLTAKNQLPDNPLFPRLADQLIDDMGIYAEIGLDTYVAEGEFVPEYSVSMEKLAESSERRQIYYHQQAMKDFYAYALQDELSADPDLGVKMDAGLAKRDSVLEWKNLPWKDKKRIRKMQAKDLSRNGADLNVERIVFVNPTQFNPGKSLNVRDLEEFQEGYLGTQVASLAMKKKIFPILLNSETLKPDDADKANDIRLLLGTLYQAMALDALNMPAVIEEEQLELAKKYNARYVANVNASTWRDTKWDHYSFVVMDLISEEIVYETSEFGLRLDRVKRILSLVEKDLDVIGD